MYEEKEEDDEDDENRKEYTRKVVFSKLNGFQKEKFFETHKDAYEEFIKHKDNMCDWCDISIVKLQNINNFKNKNNYNHKK